MTCRDVHPLLAQLSRRLGVVMPVAHVIGASAVFLFLSASAATPNDGQSTSWLADTVVFAAVGTILVAAGSIRCVRLVDRSVRWLWEERTPTAEERDATLRLPGRLALDGLLLWVVAALFYAALNLVVGQPSAQVVRVSGGIVLGGLVTTTVAHLLAERAFRSIFAVALRGEPGTGSRTLGVRARLMVAWSVGSAVPLLALALSAYGWEERAHVDQAVGVVILAAIGLVAGSAAILAASRSVADPLEGVRQALAKVEAGDLTTRLAVDDAGEVGLVQAGFNRMVVGLQERERLRDLFGRHVGTEVALHALESGTGLGGEQREASVLFVDLVGSTAMAEVLAPEQVVATLNVLFGATVRAVAAEGGWVNKFEGDGAMCVFGAPAQQPDHAARALRAARALDQALRAEASAFPGLEVGIGVSSGLVVAGNVGAEQRYEYTVLGGPVNEAARLTDLAKARPGRILASEATLRRAGPEAASWASVGSVALRGRSSPTALFEPLPETAAAR